MGLMAGIFGGPAGKAHLQITQYEQLEANFIPVVASEPKCEVWVILGMRCHSAKALEPLMWLAPREIGIGASPFRNFRLSPANYQDAHKKSVSISANGSDTDSLTASNSSKGTPSIS